MEFEAERKGWKKRMSSLVTENEKLDKKIKKLKAEKTKLSDSLILGNSEKSIGDCHMSMINMNETQFCTVDDQYDFKNII